MLEFEFTKVSTKQITKLPKQTQRRVLLVITRLSTGQDSTLLKQLSNHPLATHRVRVGDYRLLLEINNNKAIIVHIAHRREVY
jgi:mRNA-degrading endonuclease RelE of RelBE toxin-antitoxin system